MTDTCNHQFRRQSTTSGHLIVCRHCGKTRDQIHDELLAEARDLLDPSQPGTATERQNAALRNVIQALEME